MKLYTPLLFIILYGDSSASASVSQDEDQEEEHLLAVSDKPKNSLSNCLSSCP